MFIFAPCDMTARRRSGGQHIPAVAPSFDQRLGFVWSVGVWILGQLLIALDFIASVHDVVTGTRRANDRDSVHDARRQSLNFLAECRKYLPEIDVDRLGVAADGAEDDSD